MIFTAGQQHALDGIREYLDLSFDGTKKNTYLCTVMGNAGTGKTTITKEIIKMARKKGLQSICVAPSHKARRVLSNIINQTLVRTPTCTVSSLLGKQRDHSYVGTQYYNKQTDDKFSQYELIIVDEVSMVENKDFQDICRLAQVNHAKVIFIGDAEQIPNPSQPYVKRRDANDMSNQWLEKAVSPAFSLERCYLLTEIVRNETDNPMMELYTALRAGIGTGVQILQLLKGLNIPLEIDIPINTFLSVLDDKGQGYTICSSMDKFLSIIKESRDLFQTGQARVTTYTNASVGKYNRVIRQELGYSELVVKNDILMGYNNVGYNNDLIIENGQDYVVTAVEHTTTYGISANGADFSELEGWRLSLRELDTKSTVPVFLPDLDSPANEIILQELVRLATVVNSKTSNKEDYVRYKNLKNSMIFIQNLYLYRDRIYSEDEFKKSHPLLSTRTADILSEKKGKAQTEGESTEDSVQTENIVCPRSIIPGEIQSRIQHQYPDLLEERLADPKIISDAENFADMFQVLEKDMDYGYAITAHKTQGSSYNTMFVDEPSFDSLRDGWSHKHKMRIARSRERDQMKYVALTRATKVTHIRVVT